MKPGLQFLMENFYCLFRTEAPGSFSQNSNRLAEWIIFLYRVLFDSLVKSQNFDGKEKSSSSRHANPEEYRVV